MTEQETKELELFKKWWSTFRDTCLYEYHSDTAEQAWIARSKLDMGKDNEKEINM